MFKGGSIKKIEKNNFNVDHFITNFIKESHMKCVHTKILALSLFFIATIGSSTYAEELNGMRIRFSEVHLVRVGNSILSISGKNRLGRFVKLVIHNITNQAFMLGCHKNALLVLTDKSFALESYLRTVESVPTLSGRNYEAYHSYPKTQDELPSCVIATKDTLKYDYKRNDPSRFRYLINQ